MTGRSARSPRWLRIAAVVASAAVLVTSVGGWLVYRHLDGNIRSVPLIGAVVVGQRPGSADGGTNVLIVGADSRNGLSAAQLAAEQTAVTSTALSDTMILAHVPPDGSAVTLLSLPRDTWVAIPTWTDTRSGRVYRQHSDKLNAAFAEGELPDGNMALTMATVEGLARLRVDHYLQVDFSGFVGMVDAIGGIDVCLKQPTKDPWSGIDLPSGVSHLDGIRALSFVRQRHGLPGGDLDRIHRQQYFIAQVMHTATSAGVAGNPVALAEFVDRTTRTVRSDLELRGLQALALRLRTMDSAHVRFATLPVTPSPVQVGGQDVLLVDQAKAQPVLAAMGATGHTGGSSAKPADPRTITVSLLNGTRNRGLAAQAATQLRSAGFATGTIGTAPQTVSTSVIRYAPGEDAAAAAVLRAVPSAVLLPDASLTGSVQLVVGPDVTGTLLAGPARSPGSATNHPATPSAAPSPVAAVSPSPAVPGTSPGAARATGGDPAGAAPSSGGGPACVS